jgi:hypothetical protein
MNGTSLDEMFSPDRSEGPGQSAPLDAGLDAGGDGDFDDLDLDPVRRRRVSLVTGALLVALFGIAAFAGGVAVQKSQGASAATGLPGGAPAGFGGFPGGGAGAPGGATPGGSTGTTGTATGTGTTTPSAAVIGQVVSISGNTLTIKNFGGKTVVVHLPAGTTVSKTTSEPITTLTPGTTVTVSGTTASDGSVTATGVTTRGGN